MGGDAAGNPFPANYGSTECHAAWLYELDRLCAADSPVGLRLSPNLFLVKLDSVPMATIFSELRLPIAGGRHFFLVIYGVLLEGDQNSG